MPILFCLKKTGPGESSLIAIIIMIYNHDNTTNPIKDIIIFNIYQVVGNLLAWCLIAPGLDILIYGENALYAFEQGVWATLPNIVSVGVIGSVLLGVYSRIRAKDKRD